jgi:hypothetical protein
MRCADGLCGSDDCERCYPRYEDDDELPDLEYEKTRQEETDNE